MAAQTKERSLEEIEKEIAETQAQLADVHGTETEVYARIVGYYRAVKHWNKGKRDEYDLRKMFTLEDSNAHNFEAKNEEPAVKIITEEKPVAAAVASPETNLETVTYEMFTRKTCPNCPPVKAFMEEHSADFSGRAIDVDTKDGLAEAAKKGVFASPTVIFYNEQGVETARCHNVEELEAVFETLQVKA